MRSTKHISLILISSLFLTPLLALAEETTASGSVGAETTVGASGSTSGEATISPPKPLMMRESPTRRSGEMLRESPTKRSEVANEVTGSQDAVSGMATGRRTMASGTNQIPKRIEDRMQERDDRHARTVGSGTPRDCEGGVSEKTDCTLQNRGSEMKQKLMKQRIELFEHVTATIVGRISAAIERLKKLSDRLNSRIAKEKARGVDTTKAEANIAIARVKIADAETAVKMAADLIPSTIASVDITSTTTKPSDIGKPVREALMKARESIREAHKALTDAIASLSGVIGASKEQTGDGKMRGKAGASTTLMVSASSSATQQ